MALVDMFLKIDGIQGESQDGKHGGEIQVLTCSWGESQGGTFAHGGGGGAGKVRMQDFHIMMYVNKASPKLMLACATGQHIPKALLTCRKAGKDQQDYLKISFTDLLVSRFDITGTGGTESGPAANGVTDRTVEYEPLPRSCVSLNFAAIEIEYKEQKADGALGAGTRVKYDLKKMQAG
jgi:type VI secretion system secreted protein Hcp